VLGEQRAPPVEVLSNLLRDRLSVESPNTGALECGDRVEQFVTPCLPRSQFHEQGLELAPHSDRLSQIADFALDRFEAGSQARWRRDRVHA
jgi:hypothetical protein